MYNAGNGGRYALNHIWELLQQIEGVSLPAQYAASRAGDVHDSQADTTRARCDLGHDPQYSLEQGCAGHWRGTRAPRAEHNRDTIRTIRKASRHYGDVAKAAGFPGSARRWCGVAQIARPALASRCSAGGKILLPRESGRTAPRLPAEPGNPAALATSP